MENKTPNEVSKPTIISHLLIKDKNSGEILLNKRDTDKEKNARDNKPKV